MKNKIIFGLFFFLLLAGCQKDDENNPKSTADLVQGTWNMGLNKYEYYDSSNGIVHEESSSPEGVFILNNQKINIVYADGATENGTYTTQESNGKKYISLLQGGVNQTLEIITLNKNNMVWYLEKANDTYFDGNSPKTAAKSILTIEFSK